MFGDEDLSRITFGEESFFGKQRALDVARIGLHEERSRVATVEGYVARASFDGESTGSDHVLKADIARASV